MIVECVHFVLFKENKQFLNRLCRNTIKAIQQYNNNFFHNYLSILTSMKEAGYSLWTAAKWIRYPHTVKRRLRNTDGYWTRTDKEKADLVTRHCERTFQVHEIQSNITLLEAPPNPGNIKHMSPREVVELIDGLELHKTPGPDSIPPLYHFFIMYLFITVIRLCYVHNV